MNISTKHLHLISEAFEGSSIKLLLVLEPDDVSLFCGHFFSLTLTDVSSSVKVIVVRIQGIAHSYFPKAWKGVKPIFDSHDGIIREVITRLDNDSKDLLIELHVQELSYLNMSSYGEYGIEKVLNQIGTISKLLPTYSERFGYPYAFRYGVSPCRLIIARQHPGEGVTSLFVDGLIDSIISNSSPASDGFVLVPAMSLRGIFSGCYRMCCGVDLNRSWGGDVPEISHVKEIIDEFKIKEIIDIHGDETSKVSYLRSSGNNTTLFPEELRVLDNPSKIRKILSRLIRSIQSQRRGVSLQEYCKTKKITYTLIELSMAASDGRKVGRDFARLNTF